MGKRGAQATLEIVAIIMFLMISFLVLQKYIVRGISGRWKSVGDAFSSGKLYDTRKTQECAFMYRFDINEWYDIHCFDVKHKEDPTRNCYGACFSPVPEIANEAVCRNECVVPCVFDYCQDDWGD